MKKHSILIATLVLVLQFSQTAKSQTTSSWTVLNSGITTDFIGVVAISEDTSFVCGDIGTILKTENGGTTWVQKTSGTTQTLCDIDFIDNSNGFAVGDAGTVLKTVNSGSSWTSLALTSQSLRCVEFINSTTGFIAGNNGTILKTVNAGSTWTIAVTGTTACVYGICFTSSTTGYATCYDGRILKTTDGGNNWTPINTGISTKLYRIQFTSPTIGFADGDFGVAIKTVNAGATWSSTSIITSDNLGDQKFVDTNNGFILGGTSDGTIARILTTTDGGLNWTTYLTGTPRLSGLDFSSPNSGYGAGHTGTILKYSSTTTTGVSDFKSSTIQPLLSYPNPTNYSTLIDISSFFKIKESTGLSIV